MCVCARAREGVQDEKRLSCCFLQQVTFTGKKQKTKKKPPFFSGGIPKPRKDCSPTSTPFPLPPNNPAVCDKQGVACLIF